MRACCQDIAMNENEKAPKSGVPETDERLGELIRSAGRRPAIPERDRAVLEDAARSAWRRMATAERGKRLRRRSAYALAASILIALAGAWWWMADGTPPIPEEVAKVESASGRVASLPGNGPGTRTTLSAGSSILVGDALETGGVGEESAGLLALSWVHGQSVRLDAGTRLRIASLSRIELARGAIYVDSVSTVPAEEELEILTPLGVVREIGTQYEVRVDVAAGTVRVRVREGGVLVQHDGEALSAMSGGQLILHDDGSVSRDVVDPAGSDWLWVLEAAPALDIEGASLASFLEWAARETGLEVRYADEELARSASTILLHGSIEGLRPDQSIDLILQGSGLEHRVEDGAVLVFRP
jgi:hypothetical protein